jgi:hypothetical protein
MSASRNSGIIAKTENNVSQQRHGGQFAPALQPFHFRNRMALHCLDGSQRPDELTTAAISLELTPGNAQDRKSRQLSGDPKFFSES